jgi:type IV secretory pathway VirB4 component
MANKQELGNSLDLVDIKQIRDSTVVMKDGGLRQIVMVGGVNFSLKSETEQNLMTQGYQNFLNGVDFPLEVVIHSRKVNVDKYIEDLLARKAVEESPLLQNQIDEYVEFVKGFVQKNAIMEKTFLVVVPFYPTNILPTKKTAKSFLPFKKKKEGAEENAEEDAATEQVFRENLAQLNQRVSQVMTGLFNIGLEATVLADDALTELFYNFYNPQTIERKGMPLPTE